MKHLDEKMNIALNECTGTSFLLIDGMYIFIFSVGQVASVIFVYTAMTDMCRVTLVTMHVSD